MSDKDTVKAIARKAVYEKAAKALGEVMDVCFADLSDEGRISVEATKLILIRKATAGETAAEVAAHGFKVSGAK